MISRCRARATPAVAMFLSLSVACTEPAKAPQPLPASAGTSTTSLAAASSASVMWPRLPRRRLVTLDSARPIPGRPFSARIFHYAAEQGNWPYGTGISVWRNGALTPAWVYFVDGDFPPHTMVWQDLSGDDAPDLFFLAGEEDEFRTTALVWREGAGVTNDSLLVPIYSDSNSYAMLADLDGDRLPELIASGESGESEATPCEDVVLPPTLKKAVQDEYVRIAAPYAKANFTYGASDHEAWTLHLMHPVRIFSLRGGVRTDVTRSLDAHLRWRIQILEQLRPTVSRECQLTLDTLLGYLRLEAASR